MKKDILYLIIIGLLVYFIIDTCKRPTPSIDNGDDIKIEIIRDTIRIPADTSKVADIPKPKIIYQDNPKLLKQLDSIKDYNEKLLFLLSKLTIKEYDTTYTFEKGSVYLFEKVEGTILKRELEMIINEIEYEQITTTKTITKYPKFAISFGFSLGISEEKDLLYNPSLGSFIEQNVMKPNFKIDFGYRNVQGYQFDFRTNFKNNFEFGLKKDIFVKY